MRLLLLSIDGFQPSHYLEPGTPFAPLLGRGAHVVGLEPVYPTVTSTNHVSLATGVTSDQHGVATNTRFDPAAVTSWEGGESRDWIFDEAEIRAPTLWQRAVLEYRRVALLRWPVTRGARVDWLVPDVF
ncbi:MAG TPA: alkaline phosphatase family protein, partial [Bdellovibrionota bacterium]|nr:alkaline phosphatase family protein [Bdellovibrionota bacterium]